MTRQDANGQAYLAYYRTEESLAFSWAGDYLEPVEVAHGGAGEPIVARFTITPTDLHDCMGIAGDSPIVWRAATAYAQLCETWIRDVWGGIDDTPGGEWCCDSCMQLVTVSQIADMVDGEHVICRDCARELALPESMIHMAETKPTGTNRGGFDVLCRCGWQDTRTFARLEDARKAGDVHLTKANAPQVTCGCGGVGSGCHCERES